MLYCVALLDSNFEMTEISHTISHVNKAHGYVDGNTKEILSQHACSNQSMGRTTTISTAGTVPMVK